MRITIDLSDRFQLKGQTYVRLLELIRSPKENSTSVSTLVKRSHKPWTKKEADRAEYLYGQKASIATIASELGRSVASVQTFLSKKRNEKN